MHTQKYDKELTMKRKGCEHKLGQFSAHNHHNCTIITTVQLSLLHSSDDYELKMAFAGAFIM
jgi:hypothetical protein